MNKTIIQCLRDCLEVIKQFVQLRQEQALYQSLCGINLEDLSPEELRKVEGVFNSVLQLALALNDTGPGVDAADAALKAVEALDDFNAYLMIDKAGDSGWSEYLELIKQLQYERDLKERLSLLAAIKGYTQSGLKFSQLSLAKRFIVGGRQTKENEVLIDARCGLFGSMQGAGEFNGLLKSGAEHLDPVFAAIPETGEICREDYMGIVALYKQALSDAGIERRLFKPFTRLLAMARPDTFVCLTSRNERLVKAWLEAPALGSGDPYENYWDHYIAPIHNMAWFAAEPAATGEEKAIWEGRVALLDCLFVENDETRELQEYLQNIVDPKPVKPPTLKQATEIMSGYYNDNKQRLPAGVSKHRNFILAQLQNGHAVDKVFDAVVMMVDGNSEQDAQEFLAA